VTWAKKAEREGRLTSPFQVSLGCANKVRATPGSSWSITNQRLTPGPIGIQGKRGATPAEMDEIERDMSRWGRGSTFIEVNETGRRLLRILPQPYSAIPGLQSAERRNRHLAGLRRAYE
jgi:hypothetical protein